MEGFSVFDPETGAIYFQCGNLETAQENRRANGVIAEGKWDDDEYYFVFSETGYEPTPRPRLLEIETSELAADGIDNIILSNVPAGTVIIAWNTATKEKQVFKFDEVDDFVIASAEPFEITFDIRLPESAFPLRSQSIKVKAS